MKLASLRDALRGSEPTSRSLPLGRLFRTPEGLLFVVSSEIGANRAWFGGYLRDSTLKYRTFPFFSEKGNTFLGTFNAESGRPNGFAQQAWMDQRLEQQTEPRSHRTELWRLDDGLLCAIRTDSLGNASLTATKHVVCWHGKWASDGAKLYRTARSGPEGKPVAAGYLGILAEPGGNGPLIRSEEALRDWRKLVTRGFHEGQKAFVAAKGRAAFDRPGDIRWT